MIRVRVWLAASLAIAASSAACAGLTSQADHPRRETLASPAREPATQGAPVLRSPEQAAVEAAQRSVLLAERDQARGCGGWPLWQRYAEVFISDDGRVIDRTSGERSTSEGQAYALFFALVAGDRARFERILAWTQNNLAGGSLVQRLPAWHWGAAADGGYGVIDANAASDADLWLAYALIEAARLWSAPRYRELGAALAARVAREEVQHVPSLGAVLLPGPQGFRLDGGGVRLNPSYLVLPVLRRLARANVPGPWKGLITSSARILREASPRGLAPDWVNYLPGRGFTYDETSGALGSYDAIRVYLWAAWTQPRDPFAEQQQRSAAALSNLVGRIGRVPERIQIERAEVSDQSGPPGFVAVALASARASGATELAQELETQLARQAYDGLYGDPARYYDQNLALFALGFTEGRYRFAPDGRLELPALEGVCAK